MSACRWCAAGPGLQDDASRYLLAQTCMRLGKIPEAESALNPDNMGYRVRAHLLPSHPAVSYEAVSCYSLRQQSVMALRLRVPCP